VPGDRVVVTWEKDHGFALPASPHATAAVAPAANDESDA
jgi:hypothetical protein